MCHVEQPSTASTSVLSICSKIAKCALISSGFLLRPSLNKWRRQDRISAWMPKVMGSLLSNACAAWLRPKTTARGREVCQIGPKAPVSN